MSSSDPRRSTAHTFATSFVEGATSTGRSFLNAFSPANVRPAQQQLSELRHAVTHPQDTVSALGKTSEILERQISSGHVDKTRTGAATFGDMAGAGAAMVGMVALGTAVLKRPYLATRFGSNIHSSINQFSQRTASKFGMPKLHQPKLVDFAATRPLNFGLGLGVGSAVFLGGATEREQMARENALAHPELSTPLTRAKVHHVLATPLSRVRKKDSA